MSNRRSQKKKAKKPQIIAHTQPKMQSQGSLQTHNMGSHQLQKTKQSSQKHWLLVALGERRRWGIDLANNVIANIIASLVISFLVIIFAFFSTPVGSVLIRLLLILGVLLLLVWLLSAKKQIRNLLSPPIRHAGWWWFSSPSIRILFPGISWAFTIIVILLVVFKPIWCPTFLCPTPQIELATMPHGTHNQYLDLSIVGNPGGEYYALTEPPSFYSVQYLPLGVAAARINSKESSYHLILNMRSLQQGSFGMYIERIALYIKQVTPLPTRLNVWHYHDPQSNSAPSFHAIYRGERAGSWLVTTFPPHTYFWKLAPGESDTFPIQFDATIAAALQFQVQVFYRFFNEAQSRTLTLGNTLSVIFSDASNWHVWDLQASGFAPLE